MVVLLVLALVIAAPIAYYRWSARNRNWDGSILKPEGRRDHENDDPPWPRRGPSYGAGGHLGGGSGGS